MTEAAIAGLRAIDTEYKGYLFRSRLEARWAVFFDAMQAVWQYESEGYELGDGLRYLPDFVVNGNTFVEIKPRSYLAHIDANDETFRYDWDRWWRLVQQSQRPLYVCHGAPGDGLDDTQRPFEGFCLDPWVLESSDGMAYGFVFGECRRCSRLAASGLGNYSLFGCQPSCTCERHPVRSSAIDSAILAARRMRFDRPVNLLGINGSATCG